MGKHSLGSDKYNATKDIFYIFCFVTLIVLSWILVNANLTFAVIFGTFMLSFFIGDLYDYAMGRRTAISTVTEEPAKLRPMDFLRKISPLQLFLFTIICCSAVFFSSVSQGVSLIAAPTFQVAEFTQTPLFNVFLTSLVAVPETLFFFCLIFPSIFVLIYKKTGDPIISLIIAVLMASGIFSFFHFTAYGTANIIGSMATFMFGIFNCIWIYMFRSAYGLILIHAVNNFVVTFFSLVVIGVFV